MKDNLLRSIIRLILESAETEDKKEERPDDLLLEPDFPDEENEDQKEASAVGAGGGAMASSGQIRGATTPLGTTATHPKKPRDLKKKKKNASVGVRSFGGAHLD